MCLKHGASIGFGSCDSCGPLIRQSLPFFEWPDKIQLFLCANPMQTQKMTSTVITPCSSCKYYDITRHCVVVVVKPMVNFTSWTEGLTTPWVARLTTKYNVCDHMKAPMCVMLCRPLQWGLCFQCWSWAFAGCFFRTWRAAWRPLRGWEPASWSRYAPISFWVLPPFFNVFFFTLPHLWFWHFGRVVYLVVCQRHPPV